jgi:uncharacterized surface protein with fasciclin (FAS1) repeats
MKLTALGFAVAAGAIVIPEAPGQIPLNAPHHQKDTLHEEHDGSWRKFLPAKDSYVTAYDDAVDYVTSSVDNAANALHDWVDDTIAHSIDGGHHDQDYASRTLYQVINENEHTTRFAKLINDRPELVDLLNSTKTNSTLFVPIDDAFKHVPDDDKHKPSKEFVDDLLLYHVGLGNFPVHSIVDTHTYPTALKAPYLGDEPQRLRIRVGFTGVRINFYSKVVKAAETKNGIVAAISDILLPPPMVGRELTLFPDRFSTLLLAYEKTDFVDFVHKLHMEGSTVFAPSNHAFSRLGARANAFLFNTQPGLRYLRAILKYHIAPNATLYSDNIYDKTGSTSLEAQQTGHFDLGTLLGEAHLGVDIGKIWGFLTMKVNGFVRVTVQDGIARNGVIHVVDKVLLPPHRKKDGESNSRDSEDDISVDELQRRLDAYIN